MSCCEVLLFSYCISTASTEHPTSDEAEVDGSALCVYTTAEPPRRFQGGMRSLTRRSLDAM
ncbi:hypothetical protein IG631_22866 [Alternaria alternata]|nr:hypothetical protein IG631_22866 [Alternaria alternata]